MTVHRSLYPADHWTELRLFVEGNEFDPKGVFQLAADTWNAWAYAENGRPSEANKFRYRFGKLQSWLKPYVKRYCYAELLGRGGLINTSCATFPYGLTRADRFIQEQGYQSLDDLVQPEIFEAVWASLLKQRGGSKEGTRLPASAVMHQAWTRPFWVDLSISFGSPLYVPPIAPHNHRTTAEIGLDKSKLIPEAVLRQLVNKLALHRAGMSLLNRFDHLRLCVLLLLICLGRRAVELLSTPRGEGTDGPLERYPCRHDEGQSADALWFVMRPNKGGPSELVYISPEWEDITTYCVQQLIGYSDEVRTFAAPVEKHLLILVSTWNWTATNWGKGAPPLQTENDFTKKETADGRLKIRRNNIKKVTTGLSYSSFRHWLSGRTISNNPKKTLPGVLEEWKITEDGSACGPIYKLQTHQGRHTRQSALAKEPGISLTTRQQDLNHRHANTQFAYQHVLDEQNEALLSKVAQTPLHGQSDEWLRDVLGIHLVDGETHSSSKYQPGLVQLLTPRWRKLLEANPLYLEPNRVPLGVCEELDGPENCLTTKGKIEARTSSEEMSFAANFKATRTAGVNTKGQSKPRKKDTNSRVVAHNLLFTAPDSPSIKSDDVLKRLRDRQTYIKEQERRQMK